MIDGMYYCNENFIRFYKDGAFVSCLIRVKNPDEETLRQIDGWLKKGHNMVSEGRYKMKGKNIELKDSTPFGDRLIDYSGEYKNSSIVFHCLNHNNGKREKQNFKKVNLKHQPKPRKKH